LTEWSVHVEDFYYDSLCLNLRNGKLAAT
jgi:hypothetical protein